MNIQLSSCAASGSRYIATRKQPYPPSFISTPAWSIDTAVGAEAWPSGLQVWKGNRAPSTPKPTKTSGNQTSCSERGMLCSRAISTTFIVWAPEPK